MLTMNSSGYDLYEDSDKKDQWVMHVRGGPAYVGAFKKVIKHSISKLGFNSKELEYAVRDMVRKGNTACHFGIYKDFIFSFKKEFKNANEVA